MLTQQVKAGFEFIINQLGQDITWTSVKTKVTKTARMGFSGGSGDSDEIVNAYGIDHKVITIKASDGFVPEKFDRFDYKGEIWICKAVKPLHLGAEFVGYKCYVGGK
jgi:hypothetical protein